MSLTQLGNMKGLLGIGAVAGIAGAWSTIKGVFDRIIGLLIVRIEARDRAALSINGWAWKSLKRIDSGSRRYNAWERFIRPLDRYALVGHEEVGKSTLFFQKWKPLLISGGDKNDTNPHVTVSFIRGTFKPDDLIKTSIDYFNDQNSTRNKETRFRVNRMSGHYRRQQYASKDGSPEPTGLTTGSDHLSACRPIGWSSQDLGERIEKQDPFYKLALSPDVEDAIREAKNWYKSQKWFQDKEIPWRRGWLLHGKPGTGKTSLLKALAQALDIPIYSFDIGSMDNDEFYSYWSQARRNVPCMVLIEDIDAVFVGRENVIDKTGGGLTFDSFLNVVGGAESAEGIFLAITTNNVHTLDSAIGTPNEEGLSSRPGRVDRTIELTDLSANPEGRLKIANRILSDFPDYIQDIVELGKSDTGAQFQERCSSLALKLFWENVDTSNIIPLDVRVKVTRDHLEPPIPPPVTPDQEAFSPRRLRG